MHVCSLVGHVSASPRSRRDPRSWSRLRTGSCTTEPFDRTRQEFLQVCFSAPTSGVNCIGANGAEENLEPRRTSRLVVSMEALRTAQLPPQAAELVQTRWDDAEETSLFSSFLADRHHLVAGSLQQSWAPAEGQLPWASLTLAGVSNSREGAERWRVSEGAEQAEQRQPLTCRLPSVVGVSRNGRNASAVSTVQTLGSLFRFHSRETAALPPRLRPAAF